MSEKKAVFVIEALYFSAECDTGLTIGESASGDPFTWVKGDQRHLVGTIVTLVSTDKEVPKTMSKQSLYYWEILPPISLDDLKDWEGWEE